MNSQNRLNTFVRDSLAAYVIETLEVLEVSCLYQTFERLKGAVSAEAVTALKFNSLTLFSEWLIIYLNHVSVTYRAVCWVFDIATIEYVYLTLRDDLFLNPITGLVNLLLQSCDQSCSHHARGWCKQTCFWAVYSDSLFFVNSLALVTDVADLRIC